MREYTTSILTRTTLRELGSERLGRGLDVLS